MRGKRFVYNTFVLTATSILLRTIGLYFQVFISKKMGAAGVGLYYLVMSVNSFAATVAISGSRFATTRLISEELGKGKTGSVRKVVRTCLAYALFFSVLAAGVLYFSAGFIGERIIKDARTVFSLRLLSFSLPFLSLGAVLGGYFTGAARISRTAVGAISEEVFRVAVSALLLSFIPEGDTEKMCASVVIGGVIGEFLSFIVVLALYLLDVRRYKNGQCSEKMLGRVAEIAMPLAVSAYGRTALSMLQNILTPRGLKRSGKSAERALADYGTIQGMVFPIIMFPSVLFTSVSELMVPELTREQMRGKNDSITDISSRILSLCLIFSLGVMGVFLAFSNELGTVIYSSREIGRYIRVLAFLMPVMYMDTVTDGMLRGIGEQLYSMRVNIADSLISTLLVYILLPRYAVGGYIFILFSSEIFNFALSIARLKKKGGINGVLSKMPICLSVSLLSALAVKALFSASGGISGVSGLVLGIISYMAIYTAVLIISGVLKTEKLQLLIRKKYVSGR